MRRKSGRRRRTNPRILILVEGDTEKNYFLAIKQDPELKRELAALTVEVTISNKLASSAMVDEAKKRVQKARKEGNPYDTIWLVFDHDNNNRRREVWDEAQRVDFLEDRIIFSSIAFEQWYLLHFRRSARGYPTAGKLIRELKTHLPSYEKAWKNDFQELKEHLPKARKNASWLRSQVQGLGQHTSDLNPYTNVDELVDYLVSLG